MSTARQVKNRLTISHPPEEPPGPAPGPRFLRGPLAGVTTEEAAVAGSAAFTVAAAGGVTPVKTGQGAIGISLSIQTPALRSLPALFFFSVCSWSASALCNASLSLPTTVAQ